LKIAVFVSRSAPAERSPSSIVLSMLAGMVRREPARALVLPVPGGAVGAWIEAGDGESDVLAREADGSFALGDPLLLLEGGAAALLAAVRSPGEAALARLDGSFAAVVHDARAGRTLVLTDRFATRPLYEARGAHGLALASEAKALFAVPGLAPREDPLAIYDILNFGWVVGERTIFEGVRLVEDGLAIALEAGRPPARRRYRERLFAPGTLSEEDGLEAVAEAFERGVRALARRVERPALLLSGGLDSRAIASFCARAGIPLHCYTFGPRRAVETRAAAGIARALGLPIERCETPPDLLPRRAALAEWIGDGHVALADIHFLDHHVEIGPRHGGFFEGWLGGVIGGAHYACVPRDERLATKEDLARELVRLFDFQHPEPLEEQVFEPGFLARLRARALESAREFLADWDVPPGAAGAAKEAACLRFRDRRWQLFHNGVAAEPFCRALRPFALGDVVDRFQALPLAARADSAFYQKLILRHFPGVARVTWERTGRPVGAPPSRALAAVRQWKRLAFYYVGRLTAGRVDLRDLTAYEHYDRTFRRHAPLREFVEAALEGAPERRPYLRPGGIARLLDAERRGGLYFSLIARLLHAEVAARLFFDGADARAALPERVGPVRLRGEAALESVAA
jgi:hypothetical protein